MPLPLNCSRNSWKTFCIPRLDRRKGVALALGLDDGKPRTLEEVGKSLMSPANAFGNEAKSLRKLRHPSRSKRLKDYPE